MLDPLLRGVKDRMLAPVAARVGRRVHPDLVTLLGFAAGAAAALLLARREYGGALALWLANRALDGLDGAVARAQGRQSDLGGYLDILLDFALYAAIPIALVLGRPPSTDLLLALALLLAAFYVNAASWMYLAALLEKRSAGAAARGEPTSVTMPTGLVEGTETLLFYSLFILLPARAETLFLVMAALVAVTVAQRLAWAVRRL